MKKLLLLSIAMLTVAGVQAVTKTEVMQTETTQIPQNLESQDPVYTDQKIVQGKSIPFPLNSFIQVATPGKKFTRILISDLNQYGLTKKRNKIITSLKTPTNLSIKISIGYYIVKTK